MAPTEILAEQHFGKIDAWLAPLGVRIEWLTGKLKRRPRNGARRMPLWPRVARNSMVGTHALIQDAVAVRALGLAIVDEQHRFGVAQRLALREVRTAAPHLLMLSATPIPRTLAMSYLADSTCRSSTNCRRAGGR